MSRRSACFPGCPDPADPALLAHPLHLPVSCPAPGHSVQLLPVLQPSLTLTCLAEGKVCRSGENSPAGLPLLLHSEGTDPSRHQCLLFPAQVSLGRQKVISFKGSLLFPSVISSSWADTVQAEGGEGRHPC